MNYTEFQRSWIKHIKTKIRIEKYRKIKHLRKYKKYSKEKLPHSKSLNSKYLDFFEKFCKQKTTLRNKKNETISLPKSFCFIENPESVLKTIYKSVKVYTVSQTKFIKINHANVENYNLTAEVLLGIAIQKSQQFSRINGLKKRVSGTFPINDDHRQLVNSIGIVREINGHTKIRLPFSTDKQHLFSRNSINYQRPAASSIDDKAAASRLFANHVDDCINDLGYCLTKDARDFLMKCLSEVLDNAERHSSILKNDYNWHIRGYLNHNSKDKNFEISIFNFGMKMADSFLSLDKDSFAFKSVSSYIERFSKTHDEQLLCTVAALQHRASSKNEDEYDTNGQGTVVLIQFFETLYDSFIACGESSLAPAMSIVSGNTHILFDGTYRLKDVCEGSDTGDEKFVIAFNEQNTLECGPDKRYVRLMKDCYFPGVAISIRFPLKSEGIFEDG